MDKKQATITTKNAATVWMLTCLVLFGRIFAEHAGMTGVVDQLGIVAGGGALATLGIVIQSLLLHGFPTYHLDDDEPLL